MEVLSEQALRRKEDESIYIIREAIACCRHPALLWSLGKDSTALLHMVRRAFSGRMPCPVIHLDTAAKFPAMYAFRDQWTKRWNLRLIVARNDKALREGVTCCCDEKMTCCHRLKTQALQQVVARHGFDGLLVGIRRDEHGVRAKERYFSPRGADFGWDSRHQPLEVPAMSLLPEALDPGGHMRIHPLLHWSEIDVWSYMQMEQLPIVELYLARHGKRYRSLGCYPATQPVASDAASIPEIIEELRTTHAAEREGRAQDKESPARMERLRSLGYL